jgi:hypothetical protein
MMLRLPPADCSLFNKQWSDEGDVTLKENNLKSVQ